MTPRRVIIESPYAADDAAGIEANLQYARACLLDSLSRGEAPFAPHLVYPIFDDNVELQHTMGIRAGMAWGAVADVTVVYTDKGVSPGMRLGIEDAERAGRPVEYRKLSEIGKGVPYIAARRQRAEIKAQIKACYLRLSPQPGDESTVRGFTKRRS